MVPAKGMVVQPQVSYSVKGSSVSQIMRKREVCLQVQSAVESQAESAWLELTDNPSEQAKLAITISL